MTLISRWLVCYVCVVFRVWKEEIWKITILFIVTHHITIKAIFMLQHIPNYYLCINYDIISFRTNWQNIPKLQIESLALTIYRYRLYIPMIKETLMFQLMQCITVHNDNVFIKLKNKIVSGWYLEDKLFGQMLRKDILIRIQIFTHLNMWQS